jgi:hypothetical protein
MAQLAEGLDHLAPRLKRSAHVFEPDGQQLFEVGISRPKPSAQQLQTRHQRPGLPNRLQPQPRRT